MGHAGVEAFQRYQLESVLGQGGMGAVYRARDTSDGRLIALKRLQVSEEKRREKLTAAFQREYQVLSQLAHPSVIEVYEYGVENDEPYYTMEFLEGQDLSKRAPLPYKQVCALLHDVASSLSLLHARGFIHRDVTSRNIRMVSEEHAKLIDFGTIAPMGPSEEIIGTPMYVAPECLLSQRLDGRADLYSLGVTLYYALAKRFPYRARSMQDLRAAWMRAPVPLDALIDDIPPELVQLTMSLLALDRTARPRSASEVLERLAVIGELDRAEPAAASRAYLVAPVLQARGGVTRHLRGLMVSAVRGQGGGALLAGPSGVGLSRMLDAGVLEAKVLGASTVRLNAASTQGHAFDAARALVAQLMKTEPDAIARAAAECWNKSGRLFSNDAPDGPLTLVELRDNEVPRRETITALCALLHAFAHARALVIAVDDLSLVDEPSTAMLVTLLKDASRRRLMVVGALATDREERQALSLRLLQRRCETIVLEPLDERGTRRLLAGVFGKAANLDVVAARIHRLSRGYPRDVMSLAEHLVDRGIISYRGGAWVLPASIGTDALPSTFTAAMEQMLRELSPLAVRLAQCHAVSPVRTLQLEEYLRLDGESDTVAIYDALDELVRRDVLVASSEGYVIANDRWTAVLTRKLADEQRAQRHLALARMHVKGHGAPLVCVHHLLLGGDARSALEILEEFCANYSLRVLDVFGTSALGEADLGELFRRAFDALREHGGSRTLRLRLGQFMLAAGMVVEPLWFVEASTGVERELKEATGYTYWQTLSPDLAPMDRVVQALQHAQATYEATPPEERLWAPVDGIQHLAQYVVGSLAVSMNTCDFDRLRSLPGLLRPFAPLTPLLQGLMDNMSAVAATVSGDYERAAALYEGVLTRLSDESVASMDHADEIREGVIFGMAVMESRLGQQQALARLDQIDRNPRMRGNCLRLRAVLALHHGDWARADELRQQAEQYGIESAAAPLFGQDSLPTEVELYALGHDLGAVKQLLGQIEPLAARYPGWRSVRQLARAEYARLRGDLQASLEAFEQCLALCGPDGPGGDPSAPWQHAAASKIEVLLDLDRVQDAMAFAAELLDEDQPAGFRHHRVLCAIALAEARSGEHEAALRRLTTLIEQHRARQATGIVPGLAHEAAAYCALWAGNDAVYREHAAAAATEYHRVTDSGFADRYQRLQRAARRAPSGEISTIEEGSEERTLITAATGSLVASALEGCEGRASRAQRGLALICELAGTSSGFLFLLDRAGLALMATLPGARRGPGLESFANSAVDAEHVTADPETLTALVTTDLSAVRASEPPGWTGPDGRVHHLVRVRAKLAGASSLVGVAVVGAPYPRVSSPAVLDCASALGDFLLNTGEESLVGAEPPVNAAASPKPA